MQRLGFEHLIYNLKGRVHTGGVEGVHARDHPGVEGEEEFGIRNCNRERASQLIVSWIEQELPVAVDPALKFIAHLAEMGDFAEAKLFMQAHAGGVG